MFAETLKYLQGTCADQNLKTTRLGLLSLKFKSKSNIVVHLLFKDHQLIPNL